LFKRKIHNTPRAHDLRIFFFVRACERQRPGCMALVTDDHVLRVEMANEQVHTMSYEEEDTCMSYAEEGTVHMRKRLAVVSYEEEDTCMSYEQVHTMSYADMRKLLQTDMAQQQQQQRVMQQSATGDTQPPPHMTRQQSATQPPPHMTRQQNATQPPPHMTRQQSATGDTQLPSRYPQQPQTYLQQQLVHTFLKQVPDSCRKPFRVE